MTTEEHIYKRLIVLCHIPLLFSFIIIGKLAWIYLGKNNLAKIFLAQKISYKQNFGPNKYCLKQCLFK